MLFYIFMSIFFSLYSFFFFFNDTATTEIYTLSLHDALPICPDLWGVGRRHRGGQRTPERRPDPSWSAAGHALRRDGGSSPRGAIEPTAVGGEHCHNVHVACPRAHHLRIRVSNASGFRNPRDAHGHRYRRAFGSTRREFP